MALFLAVLWVCLQFVIVVFPDHTHLLVSGDTCNNAVTLEYAIDPLIVFLTTVCKSYTDTSEDYAKPLMRQSQQKTSAFLVC